MIVDDSAAMRTLIRRMLLSFEGRHQVVEARDGRHALEVFRRERPKLILLDWDMPSLSGIDFLRAFKQPTHPVTIGMVTANHGEGHQRLAAQMGASFLLPKPFARDQLWRAISPHLDLRVTGEQTAIDEPLHATGFGFEAAIVDNLNMAVNVEITRDGLAACEVNGSAGLVCCFEDVFGTPRFVLALEWTLCHYLNTALSGGSAQSANTDIASRRTTPQLRENLKEIANLIRGVCHAREDANIEFGSIVYRGDGGLRDERWKHLLASPDFQNARRYNIGLRVGGLGFGGMSIHRLASEA